MRVDFHFKKNKHNNIARNFYMQELPRLSEVVMIKDKQHSASHEGRVTHVERHVFREPSGNCTVTAHVFIDEDYKHHG